MAARKKKAKRKTTTKRKTRPLMSVVISTRFLRLRPARQRAIIRRLVDLDFAAPMVGYCEINRWVDPMGRICEQVICYDARGHVIHRGPVICR
jgi:hypothetical protein